VGGGKPGEQVHELFFDTLFRFSGVDIIIALGLGI